MTQNSSKPSFSANFPFTAAAKLSPTHKDKPAVSKRLRHKHSPLEKLPGEEVVAGSQLAG